MNIDETIKTLEEEIAQLAKRIKDDAFQRGVKEAQLKKLKKKKEQIDVIMNPLPTTA